VPEAGGLRRNGTWAMLVLGFLAWLCFAGIAVTGGILRVTWMQPQMGEFAANLIETLALVVVLALLIRVAIPWLNPALERKSLVQLGLFWAGLTLAFEFLFGHFVDGASWDVLLSNYNVAAGRLWILVPITMGVGPAVVGHMMNRGTKPSLRVDTRRSGRRPMAGGRLGQKPL
jgi:hypothetical protein